MLVIGRPWGNYQLFPSDFVTWSCWLWDDRGEKIIDFPQTVTWLYWLWEIITDFPQNLLRGHVGLWLIIIDFPETLSLGCWLWEIITDYPQNLSRGHVGYGKLSIIIDFPQTLSLGQVGYG